MGGQLALQAREPSAIAASATSLIVTPNVWRTLATSRRLTRAAP
jgi:hypothetical protein